MPTRTRWTARTLGIAVLTGAGVAAGGPASAQVGGFTPTGAPARTYLPPRQPGAIARSQSQSVVQAAPGVSATPFPFAAGAAFQPPINLGFLTFDPPQDPPPAAALPPRPTRGFQFTPGWGIGPPGWPGPGLPPQPGWAELLAKPTSEMVLDRDGSRFYRVAGADLFYSPVARTYLNPQTGVVSRPSVMALAPMVW